MMEYVIEIYMDNIPYIADYVETLQEIAFFYDERWMRETVYLPFIDKEIRKNYILCGLRLKQSCLMREGMRYG